MNREYYIGPAEIQRMAIISGVIRVGSVQVILRQKQCIWRSMMRRSIFLTALVALVISGAIAQSADVSGRWTGEMQQKQDNGDVAHAALVFTFKQAAGQVTGKAGQTDGSAQPINDAKLEGDRLTFSVTAPAGETGPTWKFDLKVSSTRMDGRAAGTNGDHSLGSTDVVMNRSK